MMGPNGQSYIAIVPIIALAFTYRANGRRCALSRGQLLKRHGIGRGHRFRISGALRPAVAAQNRNARARAHKYHTLAVLLD